MRAREPAVAGAFYPADQDELRELVLGLLRESRAAHDHVPKALIVPHAGYVYSGPIAASGYAQLSAAREIIRRVVLLGPSHRVYLEGMAFPSADVFHTPLGAVPLDRDAIEAVLELPGTRLLDEAHALEHALEVQLPFLQLALEAFSLVPFVVGGCAPERVAAVLEALWNGRETLIVVSSDLSHYLPYEDARARDLLTSEAIVDRSQRIKAEQACGADAINGLMQVAIRRQLPVRSLDLRNSGDTAGDRRSVVGYGAYAVG